MCVYKVSQQGSNVNPNMKKTTMGLVQIKLRNYQELFCAEFSYFRDCKVRYAAHYCG